MEILPLGVGEAFAKTLFQTNFLVTPAEGGAFLVDCGHTASRALHRLGIAPSSVPTVVLSHLHADHIGGLEELGFLGYFVWKTRPVLHVPEDLLPYLWARGLDAGMGQLLKDRFGRPFEADLHTYFDVRPIAGDVPFQMGSVRVAPFRTPHVPGRPSWGFRLDDGVTGRCVLLTCDSRFAPENLEAHGQGVDAVFHDCQFFGNGDAVHATLDELLTLPERWQRKTVLVHYGDDWRSYRGRTGRMRLGRQGAAYRF